MDNYSILKLQKQQQITRIIEEILRGKGNKEKLIEIINIESKRAQYVVLGCTDLSVLAEEMENDFIIDSLKILSQATIKNSVQDVVY